MNTDNLIKRLRAFDRWDGHIYVRGFGTARDSGIPFAAADRLEQLTAELARLRARVAELEPLALETVARQADL